MGFNTSPDGTLGVAIDNGGSPLGDHIAFIRNHSPFTITGWEIYADQPGSVSVNVAKSTYAQLPGWTLISGSEPPALNAVRNNRDLNLTTWTTLVNTGDWVHFSLSGDGTILSLWINLLGIRR